MMDDPGIWNFEPPIGSLRCGSLTGRVDVSHPERGVRNLCVGSNAIAGELLATSWIAEGSIGWPTRLADAYVRGGDLVANYGQLPNWPFAPQIYWRSEQGADSSDLVGIDRGASSSLSLLVSIQTDSLDSRPQIRVSTQLPTDEVIRVEQGESSRSVLPTCYLWRLPGDEWSYAEIVPASDFRDVSIEHAEAGLASVHWDLFAEFLEKGVICRARIQSVILPRERDLDFAAAYCQAMERRPLPLTT